MHRGEPDPLPLSQGGLASSRGPACPTDGPLPRLEELGLVRSWARLALQAAAAVTARASAALDPGASHSSSPADAGLRGCAADDLELAGSRPAKTYPVIPVLRSAALQRSSQPKPRELGTDLLAMLVPRLAVPLVSLVDPWPRCQPSLSLSPLLPSSLPSPSPSQSSSS